MFYLYILKSIKKKNWHYIGISSSLENRLSQHNQGKVRSTKAYRPLKLFYAEQYKTKTLARKREIELKSNSKKKELLFEKIQFDSSNG